MKYLLFMLFPAALFAKPILLEDTFTRRLTPIDLNSVSILSFIQSGCMPCKAQMKELECVKKKYGKAISIVAVQVLGTPDEIYRDLKALNLSFPVVGATRAIVDQFGVEGSPTPTSFFLKNGKPIDKVVGAQSCEFWTEKARGGK